jgi:hypothetical protein
MGTYPYVASNYPLAIIFSAITNPFSAHPDSFPTKVSLFGDGFL